MFWYMSDWTGYSHVLQSILSEREQSNGTDFNFKRMMCNNILCEKEGNFRLKASDIAGFSVCQFMDDNIFMQKTL